MKIFLSWKDFLAVYPSLSCLRSFLPKLQAFVGKNDVAYKFGEIISVSDDSQYFGEHWFGLKIKSQYGSSIKSQYRSRWKFWSRHSVLTWFSYSHLSFSDLWFAAFLISDLLIFDFLISDFLIPDLIYLTWWAFCESRVLVGLKCIPRARLWLSVWWIIYILFDTQLMCLVIITIVWQHHPQHHFFTSLGPPSSPSSSCSSSPS